jgi:hypothetical protein
LRVGLAWERGGGDAQNIQARSASKGMLTILSSAALVFFSSWDKKRRLAPMDTALFNRSETIRARLLQLRDSL